jgi:hypothetical protein
MPDARWTRIDFFISYAPADESWATWMAWELEQAGYRTMLQAWDFVPGTNFIDFMDRGVSRATAVLALLSEHYLRSRYGRLEWQAAIRASPEDPGRRLITVRIAECELEGLLSTITFVDLASVNDPERARALLLARIAQAMAGRAQPTLRPGYPTSARPRQAAPVPVPRTSRAVSHLHQLPEAVLPAPFPTAGRSPVTLLQLSGLRCAVSDQRYATARRVHKQIVTALDRAMASGASAPTAVIVTGDLTEQGGLRQFDEALGLLEELRVGLDLPARRFALVPGPCDITRAASRAYFTDCEADELTPQPPYPAKWLHFMRLFDQFYATGAEAPDAAFTAAQPWSLFVMPDAGVVVAGLNSTIADSHRDEDHYGWVGPEQVDWFDDRLTPFLATEWWRVGAIAHAPTRRSRSSLALRDATRLRRLNRHLDALLHNRRGRPSAALVALSDDGPERIELDLDRSP